MDRKRGRPKSDKKKILVAIRLEEDVLIWLRKKGRYGIWINKICRRFMNKENEKEK